MRKLGTLSFIALALGVWPFLQSESRAADQTLNLSSEQWREDLLFMARAADSIHDNPYHSISRESFDSAVAAIDRDIPSLTENQIVVRFAGLVNTIGDGHTALRIHRGRVEGFLQYPLELFQFKDGWFVRGAMPEYKRAVGARVVSIDKTPIDDVYEQLQVIVPRDNQWSGLFNSQFYIVIPALLNGLGIIEEVANSVITLKDRSGAEFRITPKLVTSEQFRASRNSGEFIYANDQSERPLPLWLRQPESHLWFEYLKESNALYVQYEHILNTDDESFADFNARMFAEVDRLSVDKLIIDVRTNGGGNNFLNKSLIHAIMARPNINQEGKLFVITGRNTFSAASHLVTYLETHTNALFVGEPMGGSPNHYGDARTVTLPNSGLDARFSTLYWQNSTPFERRRVHGPDLATRQTSDQYFDNFDPAMDAILQYRVQPPLTDRLTDWVASGAEGYERAKNEMVKFATNPLHEYISVESDLNQVGYALLGRSEIELAVRVFKLNTDVYPEKANTWDSYAEGLMAKGDTSAAILNYRKSLTLNPQNINAERMIQRLMGN